MCLSGTTIVAEMGRSSRSHTHTSSAGIGCLDLALPLLVWAGQHEQAAIVTARHELVMLREGIDRKSVV